MTTPWTEDASPCKRRRWYKQRTDTPYAWHRRPLETSVYLSRGHGIRVEEEVRALGGRSVLGSLAPRRSAVASSMPYVIIYACPT